MTVSVPESLLPLRTTGGERKGVSLDDLLSPMDLARTDLGAERCPLCDRLTRLTRRPRRPAPRRTNDPLWLTLDRNLNQALALAEKKKKSTPEDFPFSKTLSTSKPNFRPVFPSSSLDSVKNRFSSSSVLSPCLGEVWVIEENFDE